MEVFIMKATIDRDGCIGCGLCTDTCPEVFRMGDDGYAEVYTDPVPSAAEDTAVEAADNCPVSVITVE
jgi:ferredoxin